MISMWIGLFVNHFGNRRRVSASKDEVTWWAAAYQRLLRELECRTKEQAERSERQKRRLSRTLLSQQLRLGTTSRAMRDNRLTRRHRRSLLMAQDEATSLRKEFRQAEDKPATSDPYESHGSVNHLHWQYDQAKLIIVKQSSTITRTEARIEFLQGRVDSFISRRLHTNSAAHRLEDDLKFRTKQTQLMEKLNGMSVECMLNAFTNESALILVQMVRLENRIDALTIDYQTLRQQASTLMLQLRAIETSVQSQALSNYEETIDDLVSRMSIVDEELRQARADLDEKTNHRSESQMFESRRDEAIERLSIENFNIQESNRRLNFELCETQIKLGRVTRCLQDALLNNRPAITSKTHQLSGNVIESTLIEPGTKATRPRRRSSTSQMDCVQNPGARPLMPHRRRSMSGAIPLSTLDTKSSIRDRAELLSLRQFGATGLPGEKGHNGETCSMASHGNESAIIEGNGTSTLVEGQSAKKKHVRKRRQHRKMREEMEPQALIDNVTPLSSSNRP